MVTCEQATTLALAAQDRTLSRGQRLRLGIHRLLCAPCRIYRRQLQIMRAVGARLREPPAMATVTLAADVRARLRERLRAARS